MHPYIEIRLLDGACAPDVARSRELADLINRVYEVAEVGLWRRRDGRTTAGEIEAMIAAGEIAVATVDGSLVGGIHVHDISGDASEFGMLVASPSHRGTGVGRALVDFAERRGAERGRRVMQLELLLPRHRRHPSKEYLKAWYGRRGYEVIDMRRMDDAYPHLAPLLATPCDLATYEKPLRA